MILLMAYSMNEPSRSDNGGSRCGSDRRHHTKKGNFSERRLGIERRGGLDRRKALRPRNGDAIERREIFREHFRVLIITTINIDFAHRTGCAP
jgi:hypothetical protein